MRCNGRPSEMWTQCTLSPGHEGDCDSRPDDTADVAAFTAVRAWYAEGARVGLVTCVRCGCALLLDPDDEIDVKLLHSTFHSRLGY